MRKLAVLSFMLAIQPLSSLAAPTFEEAVVEQLRCTRMPHPGPILAALSKAKVIDTEDNKGYDSLSCFVLKGGLTLKGMAFASVCAFEDDEAMRAKFPEIFWRGPGTSPGQTLAFYSQASVQDLTDWHARNVGGADPERAVGAPSYDASGLGERSAVQCNSWMIN